MSESSSRLDLVAIRDALADQPELFESGTLAGLEPDTVSAARVFAHTGSTVARDSKRALLIAGLRIAGVSKREIARRVGCSANTIDGVLWELERAGKVEALKDRLPRVLGLAAEEAAERARELIEGGIVDSDHAAYLKALGVMAGIGADKSAAAAAAQQLHQHTHQHLHVEGDALRDYLRQRAAALSTDSESASITGNPLVLNAPSACAAALAASGSQESDGQSDAIEVGSDRESSPEDTGARGADTGGRGGAASAATHHT